VEKAVWRPYFFFGSVEGVGVENKFDQYTDVINRLVAETVACTPEGWAQGSLTIECDGNRINYKLKSAEYPGLAVISDELRGLAEELYVTMADNGEVWGQATIKFSLDGDKVSFDTAFEYSHKSAALPAKRPWWKLF
jgi:hypothetical protein